MYIVMRELVRHAGCSIDFCFFVSMIHMPVINENLSWTVGYPNDD